MSLQTKTYPITGMSCAACAVSSESMLKSQKGVEKAEVNYANASVNIIFDSEIVSVSRLKKSLQEIGYELITDEANSETIVEESEKNKLKEIKNNLIGSSILAFPVFIIGMFFMEMPFGNYIMMVLSAPVVFYFGRHFFVNAFNQLKHKNANMDTLVALSTGIAFFFSVFNTFYPEFWHHRGLHVHMYYESAAVVIAFILLGKYLEERAKSNTSTAIKKLMGLQPDSVTIFENLVEKTISIKEVKVGNQIIVKPGDKIPVDGIVAYGESYVDESSITGEPIPVLKKSGEKVFSGTVNQQGSFVFEATKVGNETYLAQIIKMVQQAQGSKAPVQKLVDKIAGIFVPVVLGIAIFTFAVWMIFGGENAFSHALLTSITVLVIACPCALGLATPTAIMVGVGKAAENKILIKDAESLELALKINAIVLDKTGTITQGKPKVLDFLTSEHKDLSVLFEIEKKSTHPLAKAIIQFLDENQKANIRPLTVENLENISGKGIKANFENQTFFVGSDVFWVETLKNIENEHLATIQKWKEEAKTIVCYFSETKLLAAFAISDDLKDTSVVAIQQLKSLGIDVYMLTGDNEQSAKHIADKVGITHFEANFLPNDKANFVKKLQKEGKIVAMVGDGINDSQALAQADVSIAMSKGSDIAMDVAKITLISSDLKAIPNAIHISRQTVKTIQQNLFWAFIYNIIGIPIAAGILYPINGFLLDPMIAGAAMAFSSVSVVSNSLRLKFSK